LQPQRAVAIAPSFVALDRLKSDVEESIGGANVSFLGAGDIEESLAPFTGSSNVILGLANRYDGLDLPDDDCRLLLLSESPKATNDLETNLSATWKLGPALKWREATRLTQGMGRCTRNATDFAVILLLGESLINATTNNSLLKLMPGALQKEIVWGQEQVKGLGGDPEALAKMVLGLISDADYRQDADQSISETPDFGKQASNPELKVASKEVAHSKAMWDGDFSRAHDLASEIVDGLSGDDWRGYRAWWSYLMSLAARYDENPAAELDALRRAKATGVNSGWLDQLIRSRQKAKQIESEDEEGTGAIVVERIWAALDELGWSGQKFHAFCAEMSSDLGKVDNHKQFHRGVESLGTLLGAVSSRPNKQGDPDVIWRLGERTWVCFEAKSEKIQGGTGISKADVLEAKGHVDWVRFFETQGKADVDILAALVAPEQKVNPFALPFKGSVYYLSTTELAQWATRAMLALLELRAHYCGQEFSSARPRFDADLQRVGLDAETTIASIRKTPL
jgi:hypothetical protein